MRIDIDKIVPNPFRDFEIDPIDQHQVDRLAASIEDLGFFSGCTARKRKDGTFELACGHHRYEAALLAKMTYIEAVVDNYTDNEMRRIMAIENLTQRGAHTGAMTDAVQAFAYQVAYEFLSDRQPSKSFDGSNEQQRVAAISRTSILKDGPGEKLIYQSINGFRREETAERKADDPKAEMISLGDVRKAVSTLKDSGRMAMIVAKAHALVEAERAEDAEIAAEAERKAEAQREAENERQRKAEEAARLKAEREIEARKKAEQDAKNRQAAAEEQVKLRKAREKAEAEAREQRRLELEAEAKRRKETAERMAEYSKQQQVKAAKEAEERRKVQAQLAQEKVYDSRCAQLFPDPDYAEAFRKAVLSVGAREVISRDQQYEVAQGIVADAAKWKKFSNHKLGTEHIHQFINEIVKEAHDKDRKEEAARQDAMEKIKKSMLIERLWGDVKRGVVIMDQSLQALAKEHAGWDQEADGEFPFNHNLADAWGTVSRVEKLLRRMYGGRWGIPEAEAEDVTKPQAKRIGNG